ncbi:hypothetical protein Ahy_A10g050366 [Arachis hypogaea]|uniref:F-box associated beta-propeller type 3 domain-containing protein n=1 Tax=Arachis hypogaea TaxID=3818 RepID=A0A445B997_ARAHY|nr:hypothetical protein Ahy_A10g050366 [Arachis hypogaea]
MSALTGETSPLHFPFLLTAEGWFQIVGVENGIVCIRYSSMGNKSYLLTWNPISRYSKIISDPNKHYCEGCVFLYSFLYYPNTLDYALLHVYMENPDSSTCVLTMYTIPCPENARRLNSAYVSVNGVVYWVSVITDEEDIQPPYIVSFNIITYSFDQISLPNEGLQGSHTLLVRSGHLCVAANIGDDYSYNSVIWELDQNSSSFNWTKLFSYSGIGPSYIPATIVDDDIIQIKERHLEVEDIHDFRFTHFHIRCYSPVTGSKKTLQWVNYDNVVKLWTLHKFYPGLFPVCNGMCVCCRYVMLLV